MSEMLKRLVEGVSGSRGVGDLVALGAVFGLVFVIWLIGMLLWSFRRSAREERLKERLGLIEKQSAKKRVVRLWHNGSQASAVVPGFTQRASLLTRLDQATEEAGLKAHVGGLVLAVLLGVVGVMVGCYMLTGGLLLGAGVSAVAVVVVMGVFQRRVMHRRGLFERQLVDGLEVAARSLRAGHPLVGAFQLISQEIGDPIGPVFGRICQQQALGVSLEKAIRDVALTSKNSDMKLFATAVAIQLRSGGNLADLMDSLASVVRERMKLHRRVRVLTAQTQYSKKILLGLPFVLFFVLSVIRPNYLDPLYTTSMGKMLLAMTGVSMLLGMWTMNRLAALRY